MAWRHGRALALSASALLMILTGCREVACTLKGGSSGVWLDTSHLDLADTSNVEVCLDDRCVPVHWSEHNNWLSHHGDSTGFQIDETEDVYELRVQSSDGEVLAGPVTVEPRIVYPNGKGCEPKNFVGQFTVNEDGNIVEVPLP